MVPHLPSLVPYKWRTEVMKIWFLVRRPADWPTADHQCLTLQPPFPATEIQLNCPCCWCIIVVVRCSAWLSVFPTIALSPQPSTEHRPPSTDRRAPTAALLLPLIDCLWLLSKGSLPASAHQRSSSLFCFPPLSFFIWLLSKYIDVGAASLSFVTVAVAVAPAYICCSSLFPLSKEC